MDGAITPGDQVGENILKCGRQAKTPESFINIIVIKMKERGIVVPR